VHYGVYVRVYGIWLRTGTSFFQGFGPQPKHCAIMFKTPNSVQFHRGYPITDWVSFERKKKVGSRGTQQIR
jgi:hypothetical protein